jgi:DNA-binding protein YbaB
MFDKLNQLRQLKQLQDSLSQEKTEVEKKGIRVVINGKMEVEEIQLNLDLSKEEQEETLKECINETMKKVQMAAAKKMSQISGFGV